MDFGCQGNKGLVIIFLFITKYNEKIACNSFSTQDMKILFFEEFELI